MLTCNPPSSPVRKSRSPKPPEQNTHTLTMYQQHRRFIAKRFVNRYTNAPDGALYAVEGPVGRSRERRSPMSRSSPPAWGITAGSCTSGGASSVGSAEELGGKKGRRKTRREWWEKRREQFPLHKNLRFSSGLQGDASYGDLPLNKGRGRLVVDGGKGGDVADEFVQQCWLQEVCLL